MGSSTRNIPLTSSANQAHRWHRYASSRGKVIRKGSQEDEKSEALLPFLEFTAHDIRHLRATEWLTWINQRYGKNPSKERGLRRVVQRRMGWRNPLTILCYDHSRTEYEEEEDFAEFQRETEEHAVKLSPLLVQATKSHSTRQRQEGISPSIMQQIQADLAFWEDKG